MHDRRAAGARRTFAQFDVAVRQRLIVILFGEFARGIDVFVATGHTRKSVPQSAAQCGLVQTNMVNARAARHRKLYRSLGLTRERKPDSDPLKINGPINHS